MVNVLGPSCTITVNDCIQPQRARAKPVTIMNDSKQPRHTSFFSSACDGSKQPQYTINYNVDVKGLEMHHTCALCVDITILAPPHRWGYREALIRLQSSGSLNQLRIFKL